MRVWQVEALVARVREASNDDNETAHGLEDDLWADVLNAIARGDGDDPKKLARAALKTRGIDFERWCA